MPKFLGAALAALVCTFAAAQTPPCVSLNDTNTTMSGALTSYGFAGQNSFGWQITPTSSLVVQAAQVFTRNNTLSGDRYMILEIWSDGGGLPGTRLGGGAWKIVNSRAPAWQGADLDSLVVLQANQPAWLVWVEPGFSNPCEEPGGILMPKATRNGANWVTSAASAPKFRLFCNQLDDVHSAPVGVGCPQSNGLYASVYTNEQPTVGNSNFFFESSGNPSGGGVFVIFGFNPGFTPIPVPGFPAGCFQNTDIVSTLFATAGTGNTRGPTCAGYLRIPLALPSDQSFVGFPLAVQVVTYDANAAAPLPFAASNAQRVTLY